MLPFIFTALMATQVSAGILMNRQAVSSSSTTTGTITATVFTTVTGTPTPTCTSGNPWSTITTTITVTSIPTPSQCPCIDPTGLQYQQFEGQQGTTPPTAGYIAGIQPNYPGWDTGYLKGNSSNPNMNIQSGLSGVTSQENTAYAKSPGTVMYRGFIKAPETGSYTITMTNVDDVLAIWTGNLAISGWGRSNTTLEAFFQGTPKGQSAQFGSNSTQISLNQGQFLPIRIVFANGDGPGSNNLTIKTPSGNNIFGDSTNPPAAGFAGAIVPYSTCYPSQAPQYPAWGTES